MINAIVTDIEGTTSSISFVHEVLFPYARKHLESFLMKHFREQRVAEQIDAVKQEVGQDMELASVIHTLECWIDQDRKVTPLKVLQGMIWETGYQNGDFKGHIYPDAVEYLKTWHEAGIELHVFSSGSVAAQKLLFGHTEWGDLTPLFSGYFDTRIGGKNDPDSYQKIIAHIEYPAKNILFLSDVESELEAADSAGMQTFHLVRDQEPALVTRFRQARDFSQIEVNQLSR
ncbi:MAG: acireductone synthase [Gammaproteobacteria bacterium]|nr:MAG: acireductone synthase [Gammaproteobacteria bacterium]